MLKHIDELLETMPLVFNDLSILNGEFGTMSTELISEGQSLCNVSLLASLFLYLLTEALGLSYHLQSKTSGHG
jgi:hypothetical protein